MSLILRKKVQDEVDQKNVFSDGSRENFLEKVKQHFTEENIFSSYTGYFFLTILVFP